MTDDYHQRQLKEKEVSTYFQIQIKKGKNT